MNLKKYKHIDDIDLFKMALELNSDVVSISKDENDNALFLDEKGKEITLDKALEKKLKKHVSDFESTSIKLRKNADHTIKINKVIIDFLTGLGIDTTDMEPDYAIAFLASVPEADKAELFLELKELNVDRVADITEVN